jgi:DNA-binding IclR family transcriptional regulator
MRSVTSAPDIDAQTPDTGASHAAGEAGKAPDRRMGVQVIARAAEICRELATAVDGLTTAELVERLHLSRPTVYRILRALMDEDFVRQVTPGRFAIGPAFLVIAGSTYGGLRHDMRPFMKDLSNELGETIDLAMLDAGEALFVDQFVAVRGLRVVAHMGARLPLHSTASGKALLAVLEPDEIERELPKRLQGYTPNTVIDRAALLRQLDDVRRTGVAYDHEEYVMGVCAIATPVHDAVGAVGALTVEIPAVTLQEQGREEHIAEVLLRHRDRAHRALLGSPRRQRGQEPATG